MYLAKDALKNIFLVDIFALGECRVSLSQENLIIKLKCPPMYSPLSHRNLHAKKVIVSNIVTRLITNIKNCHLRNVHFSKYRS